MGGQWTAEHVRGNDAVDRGERRVVSAVPTDPLHARAPRAFQHAETAPVTDPVVARFARRCSVLVRYDSSFESESTSLIGVRTQAEASGSDRAGSPRAATASVPGSGGPPGRRRVVQRSFAGRRLPSASSAMTSSPSSELSRATRSRFSQCTSRNHSVPSTLRARGPGRRRRIATVRKPPPV